MKLRSLLGLAASILILLTGCKEPDGTSGGTSGGPGRRPRDGGSRPSGPGEHNVRPSSE